MLVVALFFFYKERRGLLSMSAAALFGDQLTRFLVITNSLDGIQVPRFSVIN
jgi:hypothetical protein